MPENICKMAMAAGSVSYSPDIVGTVTEEASVMIFLTAEDSKEEVDQVTIRCLIDNSPAKEIMQGGQGETIPCSTLFLWDNSISMPEDRRKAVKECIEKLVSKSAGEEYAIGVYDEKIKYVTQPQLAKGSGNDYISSVSYEEQNTCTAQILQEQVREAISEYPARQFKKLIFFTDGEENSEGINSETLQKYMDTMPCSITIISCAKKNSTEEQYLRQLSAMVGASWHELQPDKLEELVTDIREEYPTSYIRVIPPEEFMDGSRRELLLVWQNGQSGSRLVQNVYMPIEYNDESNANTKAGAEAAQKTENTQNPGNTPNPGNTQNAEHEQNIENVKSMNYLKATEPNEKTAMKEELSAGEVGTVLSQETPVSTGLLTGIVAVSILGAALFVGILCHSGWFNFFHKKEKEKIPEEKSQNTEFTVFGIEDNGRTGTLWQQDKTKFRIRLEYEDGKKAPIEELIEGTRIMGRSRENGIIHVEGDNTVSGRHCELTATAGSLYMRDLDSANGTFWNDKRVLTEVLLSKGDSIRLGRIKFKIERLISYEEDNAKQ